MSDDKPPKDEKPPRPLTEAERRLIAGAQDQIARTVEALQGPAKHIADAMKLQEDVMRRLLFPNVVAEKLMKSVNVGERFAEIFAPQYETTMKRLADVIGSSTQAASILDGISVAPVLDIPFVGRPEVEATWQVQSEVQKLAKIAAASAREIANLAAIAQESLQQTVSLVAAVQQLHDTTRAGIESNDKTANALVSAVDGLEGTTDEGLTGTRKAVRELVDAVGLLHRTTAAGIEANDKSAKSVIRWTRALFVLTAVLAGLTVGLLYETYRLLPAQ